MPSSFNCGVLLCVTNNGKDFFGAMFKRKADRITTAKSASIKKTEKKVCSETQGKPENFLG